MRETRSIMGMPVEIEVVGENVQDALDDAFSYLVLVDERFSTYKAGSEISRINRGEHAADAASEEMKEVLAISTKTKEETDGYFDIHRPDGSLDPSGIVKGWAIRNAAARIRAAGHENFFVNAGGDIASSGKNVNGEDWSVGIRNPFNKEEVVKVIYPRGRGVATSGSYIRGDHIYNPHAPGEKITDVVSLTVIGPDVLEADRFATAAFAMGKRGINFIGRLPGFDAYQIAPDGTATMTKGFPRYTRPT